MGAGGASRRTVAGLFRPAARLLGRLRYAQKFIVVGLVLLVPLALVAGAYIDLQREQIAFSAKERSGVVLMRPLIDLTAHLVQERHDVTAGLTVSADLDTRLAAVDAQDRRVGARLDTRAAWRAARELVVATRAGTDGHEAHETYDDAVAALLDLIVEVGDASNLTLDPDIDSYYLMDTLQFRLPVLLDVAGHSADAVAEAGGTRSDLGMNLGINHGVVTDIRRALVRAADAVAGKTADPVVRADARARFARLDAAAGRLDGALSVATSAGHLGGVAPAAAELRREAMDFAPWVAGALDRLLRTRIAGFADKALRVGIGSGVAGLLAVYLFVGFYLSITRPIRAIVATLAAVAGGDLTRRVSVDTHDELGFVATALNDTIARTEAATDRLATRATHDALTRLPNRDHVLDRLAAALDRSAATGALMGVLFVDLDRFKIVNDSLGHEAGDEVLRAVAGRLSALRREGDLVGRLAGDEFVVICENLPSIEDAVRVAERIVARVNEPIVVRTGPGPGPGGAWTEERGERSGKDREASVGASVGIAVADGSTPADAADLLRDADVAMYHAKQRGRGRVEVFDDALRVAVQERLDLHNELRHAIEAGEICAYYQPIVAMADDRVLGFEALARWHHPDRGVLGAAEFIPVAEESGLIVPLGLAILRQACAQTAAWRREWPELRVVVNVSGTQFADPSFVDTVAAALAETGLEADALWLDITETSLMTDAAAARETLDRVRALGAHLAVDDFGTGYSSLAYLRSFPVEALKIDRSFVSGLGDEGTDEAIVAMIVALARTLGLAVVAEGVETRAQLARLAELGCDIAQGYLYDQPSPPECAWFGPAVPATV
jgi:diguanylate cyclase (GGDEF)-like protein